MNRKHLAGVAVLAALLSSSAWAQQSPAPGSLEAIQALQCDAKKAQCGFKACPTGQSPVMTTTPCECVCKASSEAKPPMTPLPPPPLIPGAGQPTLGGPVAPRP